MNIFDVFVVQSLFKKKMLRKISAFFWSLTPAGPACSTFEGRYPICILFLLLLGILHKIVTIYSRSTNANQENRQIELCPKIIYRRELSSLYPFCEYIHTYIPWNCIRCVAFGWLIPNKIRHLTHLSRQPYWFDPKSQTSISLWPDPHSHISYAPLPLCVCECKWNSQAL